MENQNVYTNQPTTKYGAVQSSYNSSTYGQPPPGQTFNPEQPTYGQPLFGQPTYGRPYEQQPPAILVQGPPTVLVQGTVYTTDNIVTSYSTGNIPSNFIPTRATTGEPATNVPLGNNQLIKSQTNANASASFILITGGMNIAWSCGFSTFIGFQRDTHIMICWYIAAIVGALIGAFITNRKPKKPIYMFSAFLVLIAGILFVALPHKYGAIAAARYLNGFGVGLVFVPMLVLIGEEVYSGRRGLAAALFDTGDITLGMYLQILFFAVYDLNVSINYYDTFSSIQLNGIIAIILSILSIILSYFFVIESPIYYLLRNEESQAIDCLRRLQYHHTITQQTYQQLEEHKRYIESNSPSGDLGLLALLKLCLYRGLTSLSFSPVTTAALLLSGLLYDGLYTIWPYTVFGLLSWFGSFFSGFIMDVVGRKKLMLVGVLVSGGLAIGIGSIYNDIKNIIFNYHMGAVLYMLFVLAFFSSIFRSVSSAYLTEAFPLQLKPYYIAISFIVEMLVLLIIGLCTLSENSFGTYFIIFGILYLIFFVFGIVFLPETKKLTLREAQDKFKNFINISF